MRFRSVAIAVALAGCTAHAASPPPEALIGNWDLWCHTDDEVTATCVEKNPSGFFLTLAEGGELVDGYGKGKSERGRWTLTGSELAATTPRGSGTVTERFRVRIENDRLVLWSDDKKVGKVFGRTNATFTPTPGPLTTNGPSTGSLRHVAYRIAVPAGSRLVSDDGRRRRWAPSGGDGFSVEISVSSPARTEVDGKWTTPPCNDYDYSGAPIGSSHMIDGVERDTAVSTSVCVAASNDVLSCTVGHTRGYLQPSEKAAALAVCKSLSVVAGR